MRWRLVVLALLTLAAVALVVAFAAHATALQLSAQEIWNTTNSADSPSQADNDRAQQLSIESYSLQLAITPVGTAALICGTGVLVVLSRQWQLRVRTPERAR